MKNHDNIHDEVLYANYIWDVFILWSLPVSPLLPRHFLISDSSLIDANAANWTADPMEMQGVTEFKLKPRVSGKLRVSQISQKLRTGTNNPRHFVAIYSRD